MQPDISGIPIRDIHLPQPVSWWPPAPGWWVLLALLLIAVAIVVWLKTRRREFRLRFIAMTELDDLYQAYQQHLNAGRFASDLSVLLRRISISYFPQENIAGLTGSAWLRFLDSRLSANGNKSGQWFSDGVGIVLIKAPYQNKLNNNEVDVEALYKLSEEWIESLGPVRPDNLNRPAVDKEAARVSV